MESIFREFAQSYTNNCKHMYVEYYIDFGKFVQVYNI